MLEKFIVIDNVGVFQAGVPKSHTLKKATLIYADNARGKSTLSAILQACSTGDAAPLAARATIGAKGGPRVQLRFALPSGGTNVTFETGKWDTMVPSLVVFDQAFVERNVYAGSEVHPENHQALLDFAIGTAAVAKKAEVEDLGAAQTAATKARTAAEDKLTGYRAQTPLATFLALTNVENPDEQIAGHEKRIANAREAALIQARAGLKPLVLPTADFDGLDAVLKSSFEQVHENAQAIVRTHLESHGGMAAAQWVEGGQVFHKDNSCPFCGQDTEGLELIAAYGTYFSAEYAAHMTKVKGLPDVANHVLPEPTIAAWETECQANADRATGWLSQLKIECPTIEFPTMRDRAAAIRTALRQAAADKAQAPLTPLDTAALDNARATWALALDALMAYNDAVDIGNGAIGQFKKGLAADTVTTLEGELLTMRARKIRHTSNVVAVVEARATADAERTKCENAKAKARGELDSMMAELLNRYRTSINEWLVKFGAPFSIERLKASYVGGGVPRTDYGIALRGKVVAAGRKNPNALSFHTVLSDGDKRTLALAFFLARVLEDKGVANTIIVLDDVFASFDKDRRSTTVTAICELAKRCAQVIVLGHDAYFLREVAHRMSYKNVADTLTLQIRRAANDFSELAECDLAALCASEYHKRYQQLSAYLAGAPNPNLLAVAEGLRPLVEGSLHRRFPGVIRDGVPFGVMLDQIKKAIADNPLHVLQPQLDALHAFNDFAGAFHHDTTGAAPKQNVSDGELQTFGKLAMKFVHEGTMV